MLDAVASHEKMLKKHALFLFQLLLEFPRAVLDAGNANETTQARQLTLPVQALGRERPRIAGRGRVGRDRS